MRSRLHRLVVSTGLAAATLLGIAGSSFAQPRDRRHEDREHDRDAVPREAPPPPRAETHDARRVGFVWIGGRWDWSRRDHRWDWLPGRWEPERRGKRWREARWEQRDGVYVLVDGDWIAADLRFPVEAPPSPRVESLPPPRPGFVWAHGRWDWRDGRWTWLPGHWEGVRIRMKWVDGRWELRGDHWEWIDGSWAEESAPPPASGPTQAPPPPQVEAHGPAASGFLWASGRWDWKDGRWTWLPGHWERIRPRMRWVDGRWKLSGDRWGWVEGGWIEENGAPPAEPPLPAPAPPPATGPSQAPPPPQVEAHGPPAAGFLWASGRWAWKDGRYEWLPGHWERIRARLTWYDGRWELQGNVWVYVEGGWR